LWAGECVIGKFDPAITTVRLPLRRLGEVAASMLLDHLGGAGLGDVLVDDPAPELVVMATTGVPAK
jgi:LacI family transcriptional regulator